MLYLYMINRGFERIFFLVILALVFVTLPFLYSCDNTPFVADDLVTAREACADRNWPLAERLLERYLRKEQNPDKRWDAWELLLTAINASSPEPRASLECLEAMLVEYENDYGRLAPILMRMGKYNKALRHYDRGADAWSAYVELPNLEDSARVEGYRNLAEMQFGQRHFEAGEETLQQCLGLPLPDHDKIYCMLDLAHENMARERWQEVADLCQQILDSEPDDKVIGMAGYLRGDALEQLGHTEEALRQFELARDSYPNPAVMDNRIAHLKKNSGKQKE